MGHKGKCKSYAEPPLSTKKPMKIPATVYPSTTTHPQDGKRSTTEVNVSIMKSNRNKDQGKTRT